MHATWVGDNVEYGVRLAEALRALGARDEHVIAVAEAVRETAVGGVGTRRA